MLLYCCDHVTPSPSFRRWMGGSSVDVSEPIQTMATPLTNNSVDILEVEYTLRLTALKFTFVFG